jgi:transcriptional regulator with XRE-family HTH domain
MEVIKLSFGKRLKEARTAKKLTQVEVADKLGIDDTTISKYENDKSEPDNETLTKLLDLYEVNFDYIHGRELKGSTSIEETEMERMKREIREIVSRAKTEEDVKSVLHVIKKALKE